MLPSEMPDYPALLPDGLHEMTFDRLRELCVTQFKDRSKTREQIMAGFEGIATRIGAEGIRGDLWVNGSFLTAKIDPSDCDIVLFIDGDDVDRFTEQQEDALIWLESDERKVTHLCDAYADARYPQGHPDEWIGTVLHDYWRRWYGRNGGGRKGIAVIHVEPTTHG